MTDQQVVALAKLCSRYNVLFRESDYTPQFDLPTGWVAGWIGGNSYNGISLYVGCSPEGDIHS